MAGGDARLPAVPVGRLSRSGSTAGKPSDGVSLADELAAITGHSFADIGLATRALTHASAAGRPGADYQRLEFLGDRVLGLTVAELLFHAFPEASEGELSVRLNALVNAEALAAIADETGLARHVHAGSDIRGQTGRKRINVNADVVEALIAALFIDGGLDAARGFVHRHWQARALAEGAARRDSKTELQEWAHQAASVSPVYQTASREGPDHEPVFTVRVTVGTRPPAYGRGRSKREAEQNAAAAMLEREGVWKATGESK